jgi:hypothetical protein
MSTQTSFATVDDLMDFDGKAELINGRLIEIMAVGYGPAEIPDYYVGPLPPDDMAENRADDFEAGTRVAWDVCPQTREVRKYVPGVESPTVFTLGMVADAEPAVPGWAMSVDDVFEQI